jgi:hypothetical protein
MKEKTLPVKCNLKHTEYFAFIKQILRFDVSTRIMLQFIPDDVIHQVEQPVITRSLRKPFLWLREQNPLHFNSTLPTWRAASISHETFIHVHAIQALFSIFSACAQMCLN